MGGHRRLPEIGIVVFGRIGHARQVERLAPLHAGAAASAMARPALVAGPGLRKGRARGRARRHDVGFGAVNEGHVQHDIGIPLQRRALHGGEGVRETGPAIGIDEVIAPVDRGRHRRIAIGGSDAKGHGQHDRVAVGDHRHAHRLFGIMAVGHGQIVGQRRSRQRRAQSRQVDQVERHAQPQGAGAGKIQLLAMPLAVIKADDARQAPLGRKDMGKRDGIQPARADKCSVHV